MGADDDVDFPIGKVGEYLLGVFGRACTAQVLHPHRKLFEPFGKCVVVLVGEHGGGHEHGCLLGVGGGLEGGADGHFCFAEPHVAAHKSVHRSLALHVGFHRLSGCELVGGVLVGERSLELMLHVCVGRESESLLLLSGGIQFDQVAGYILELGFSALLDSVPCPGAEGVDFGRHSLFTAIFGELVKCVDRHEYDVVVGIHELDHLLCVAVDIGAQQPGKFSHAVVHMHYVVTRLNGTQLLEAQRELAGTCAVGAEIVFVEPVKNLVVGEHATLLEVVHKPLVEGGCDGSEAYLVAPVGKNLFEAFKLFFAVGEYQYLISIIQKLCERVADKVEILVVYPLRRAFEINGGRRFVGASGAGGEP